jgi:hypothetical protein
MFGSGRGDLSKTGLISGIVIAVVIAAAFIGWGLSKSAEYQRQADDHTREYAAYAYDKIWKTCPSPIIGDHYECSAQARHEQRAYERDEQDLVAQRQSALWAYIMGAAAVIGMGLSVVGVLLVWTTFRETKRANEITERIAKLERRPWISLSMAVSDFANFSRDDFCLRVAITIKNVGQSPANGVSIRAKGFNALGPRSHVQSEFLDQHLEETADRISSGLVLIPNEEIVTDLEIKIPRGLFNTRGDVVMVAPFVIASIAYGATLDSSLMGQTCKGYLFRQMLGGGYAFRDEMPLMQFLPEHITMRHAFGYARAT